MPFLTSVTVKLRLHHTRCVDPNLKLEVFQVLYVFLREFTVCTINKLDQGRQSILFQVVTQNDEEETVLDIKQTNHLSLN